MKSILDMTLEEIYLDWVNNYLTIGRMAEDYGINKKDLSNLIDVARNIREQVIQNENRI